MENSSGKNSLDFIEVETGPDPQYAVIWLHGLGADGHDFEPLVPELRLPQATAIRFVFPHAPVRPVTINAGMRMRAWYDILTLDRDGPVDEQGIRASSESLTALMTREHERGIDFRNLIVAGFSQGGAIATYASLRFAEPLGGLIALSTYMPLAAALKTELEHRDDTQNRDMPIFMAHGSYDPMLPILLGEQLRDLALSAGFGIDWHAYPMAHEVCAQEIADLSAWFRERLTDS